MSGGGSYRRLSHEADIELPNLTGNNAPQLLSDGLDMPTSTPATTGELSGIYFGILNIYTTIPQFLGTLIATVVFSILEPGKSRELASDAPATPPEKDGPNAIGVCLFIGAISTVGAAFATRKLKKL